MMLNIFKKTTGRTAAKIWFLTSSLYSLRIYTSQKTFHRNRWYRSRNFFLYQNLAYILLPKKRFKKKLFRRTVRKYKKKSFALSLKDRLWIKTKVRLAKTLVKRPSTSFRRRGRRRRFLVLRYKNVGTHRKITPSVLYKKRYRRFILVPSYKKRAFHKFISYSHLKMVDNKSPFFLYNFIRATVTDFHPLYTSRRGLLTDSYNNIKKISYLFGLLSASIRYSSLLSAQRIFNFRYSHNLRPRFLKRFKRRSRRVFFRRKRRLRYIKRRSATYRSLIKKNYHKRLQSKRFLFYQKIKPSFNSNFNATNFDLVSNNISVSNPLLFPRIVNRLISKSPRNFTKNILLVKGFFKITRRFMGQFHKNRLELLNHLDLVKKFPFIEQSLLAVNYLKHGIPTLRPTSLSGCSYSRPVNNKVFKSYVYWASKLQLYLNRTSDFISVPRDPKFMDRKIIDSLGYLRYMFFMCGNLNASSKVPMHYLAKLYSLTLPRTTSWKTEVQKNAFFKNTIVSPSCTSRFNRIPNLNYLYYLGSFTRKPLQFGLDQTSLCRFRHWFLKDLFYLNGIGINRGSLEENVTSIKSSLLPLGSLRYNYRLNLKKCLSIVFKSQYSSTIALSSLNSFSQDVQGFNKGSSLQDYESASICGFSSSAYNHPVLNFMSRLSPIKTDSADRTDRITQPLFRVLLNRSGSKKAIRRRKRRLKGRLGWVLRSFKRFIRAHKGQLSGAALATSLGVCLSKGFLNPSRLGMLFKTSRKFLSDRKNIHLFLTCLVSKRLDSIHTSFIMNKLPYWRSKLTLFKLSSLISIGQLRHSYRLRSKRFLRLRNRWDKKKKFKFYRKRRKLLFRLSKRNFKFLNPVNKNFFMNNIIQELKLTSFYSDFTSLFSINKAHLFSTDKSVFLRHAIDPIFVRELQKFFAVKTVSYREGTTFDSHYHKKIFYGNSSDIFFYFLTKLQTAFSGKRMRGTNRFFKNRFASSFLSAVLLKSFDAVKKTLSSFLYWRSYKKHRILIQLIKSAFQYNKSKFLDLYNFTGMKVKLKGKLSSIGGAKKRKKMWEVGPTNAFSYGSQSHFSAMPFTTPTGSLTLSVVSN